jgi:hypothetical protein
MVSAPAGRVTVSVTVRSAKRMTPRANQRPLIGAAILLMSVAGILIFPYSSPQDQR